MIKYAKYLLAGSVIASLTTSKLGEIIGVSAISSHKVIMGATAIGMLAFCYKDMTDKVVNVNTDGILIEDDRSLIIRKVLENLNIQVTNSSGVVLRPKLSKIEGNTYVYKAPSGICGRHFEAIKPAIEFALNAEIEIWELDKKIYVRVMDSVMPELILFHPGESDNDEFISEGFENQQIINGDTTTDWDIKEWAGDIGPNWLPTLVDCRGDESRENESCTHDSKSDGMVSKLRIKYC